MTRFLDGPAKGETLLLQNAPVLLRVTLKTSSLIPTWDALDAIGDVAAADEAIYAYRRQGPAVSAHLNFGRARKGGARSGFYSGGEYKVVDPQPPDAVLRTERAWYQWANAQVGDATG